MKSLFVFALAASALFATSQKNSSPPPPRSLDAKPPSQSSPMSYQNALVNPYSASMMMNPLMNPFMNPYTYSMMGMGMYPYSMGPGLHLGMGMYNPYMLSMYNPYTMMAMGYGMYNPYMMSPMFNPYLASGRNMAEKAGKKEGSLKQL